MVDALIKSSGILLILLTPMVLGADEYMEVSDTLIINQTLQELSEISGIEYKIITLKPEINMDLAHDIAVSIYENGKDEDIDLILSIMRVESYFNPRATSPSGAQGLMQIMPFWTHEFGARDFYGIDDNIKAGIRILSQYKKMFSRVDLVLTAYNRGPVAVKRDLRDGKNPRNGYARSIIRMHKMLKQIDLTSTYIAVQ